MPNTSKVLIFGATGGIGSSLTRLLARRGWDVHAVARGEDRLGALADEIGCRTFSADVTDPGAVASAFVSASQGPGTLRAVVNCVGSILLKPAHLISDAEWDRTLALNLTSCFRILRESATALKPEGGSVLFVSSAAAVTGLTNHEAIAAAKAGVEGLVRSAAATYAPARIRVNAVAPGLVETPLTERITGNAKSLEFSRAMHAVGRIGQPGDIAAMLAYLCGDEAEWITGQIFRVDGGLATVRTR